MTTTTSKTPLEELKDEYDKLSAAERLAIRQAFMSMITDDEEDDDEPPFIA